MKTKMKKYEDGGSTRKARLEGRATKKMGKAQRTYKEAEATLSEAKSSGMKMDYADAEQLFNRSARQGDRAKKLKAKAAMMKTGGTMKKPLHKAQFGKTVNRSVDSNEYGSTAEIDKTGKAGKSKVKTIEISNRGSSMVNPSSKPTARIDVRKYDSQGMDTAKPKSKEISTNRAQRMINRQAKKATVMKTGGMVNSNAKVSKQTVPGSKGVKSGVNPKASASKVAKGRSGGTSTAPKTAVPKAKYGMTTKPTMKRGGSMKKK
jgi:hypothetical protein